MNSLPECTICHETIFHFRVSEHQEYAMLCNKVCEYVGADSWAVIVNNEVLFNDYDSQQSARERILDDCVRTAIIGRPHQCLFVPLHRADTNAQIEIYMFGEHSMKIRLTYDAETKRYTAEQFYSAAYVQRFGVTMEWV